MPRRWTSRAASLAAGLSLLAAGGCDWRGARLEAVCRGGAEWRR